jgi:glycosyltransferase involved in cell wall biosynthesis
MSKKIIFMSIVIPLYNKARHIYDTIQSVLEQSHQDFEVIVVDDGSTDGGGEIVSQINDPRIRLIQQKNGGVSKARNTGIENASHELIAFLDGDDTWLPNHLETLHRMAMNFPEAGIYATSYVIKKGQEQSSLNFQGIPENDWEGIIPDYFKSMALGHNITWSSAIAVKKIVFNTVGMFPVGVRMGEDLDMWFRIALKYPVCFSSEVSAIYEWDTDNRACSTYKISDLHSPILTSWMDYDPVGYMKIFMLKNQNHLLRALIIDGYGKEVRPIILKMAKKYGFMSIVNNYIFSYFNKNLYDFFQKIKHMVRR